LEKFREKRGDKEREIKKEREIIFRNIDRYRMERISVKYKRIKIISRSQRELKQLRFYMTLILKER
jgi:hypothetical protein